RHLGVEYPGHAIEPDDSPRPAGDHDIGQRAQELAVAEADHDLVAEHVVAIVVDPASPSENVDARAVVGGEHRHQVDVDVTIAEQVDQVIQLGVGAAVARGKTGDEYARL